MSTLESVIWHILGYSAMPVIILGDGFAGVAAVSLWLLSMTKDKEID
ncbi:TIGR02808 family protein [Vibrio lentus]|nr:TIGR02808 family protein [Vibrio lentus]